MFDNRITTFLQIARDRYIPELTRVCAIDSGSYHKPGIDQVQDHFQRRLTELGFDVERVRNAEWGDDLVARLDPKLDRKTMTLEIKGFWHEDNTPIKDVAFADALANGLIRFAKFVGAKKVDVSTIKPRSLRIHIQAAIKKLV